MMAFALLACMNVSAQNVNLYKDNGGNVYCNVSPQAVNISDTALAVRLSITTNDDNQMDYAKIYYVFFDVNNNAILRGNFSLTGTDYSAWKDNNYLYHYVATKLDVAITQ